MGMTRRDFLAKGMLALGVAVTGVGRVAGATVRSAGSRTSSPLRLRIGILADLHLKEGGRASDKFERALRQFRRGRVDGVLICGDLADNGLLPQLQEVANVWEKVFPGSKGGGGSHVERLFHYGDHDNGGYAHKGTGILKKYGWTEEERKANTLFYHARADWERVFGEPWSPVVHKKVKGYDFILSHHTRERSCDAQGLDKFFANWTPDPDKPFFFSKHRVLRNTVNGPSVWGQDNGRVGKLLAAYPNCVAFCGHSHQTAVREDSIWQGEYTAIQVPSLNYVTTEPGRYGTPDCYAAEQGMLLDVYDDRMVVRRLDFANAKQLAPAWTIPLVGGGGGAKPFDHEERRRVAVAPEFPAGASLETEINRYGTGKIKSLTLTFPVVKGLSGGVRAYDYEVTVDGVQFGGDARRAVKRFFSPKAHWTPSAEPDTMQIDVPMGEFKSQDWGGFHVAVRPREIFGRTGRALETDL